MKIVIIGNTSMVAKRIRSRLNEMGNVLMAGRSAGADVNFDLAGDYVFDERTAVTDVIIHCAASFEGNQLDEAARNELVNSVGSFRVAQLARETGCAHLVYISSISVYDHPENQCFGSYGMSKRHAQENLAWACGQMGVRFTALVASQIYDEFGEARKHQPLFYRIIDAARAGTDVTLYGQVDAERNFLFVGDLAEVVRRVIQSGVTGTHTVVHPKSDRLSEIAETAFQVFDKGGKVVFKKDMPDIPTIHIPANTDLYGRIEYIPQTGLVAGIGMVKNNMR